MSRICLDTLKSGVSRREQVVDVLPETADAHGLDPAERAATADAAGAALLVVLDQLGAAERLASVPHDLFRMPRRRSGRPAAHGRPGHFADLDVELR